jgi:AsmA protein
MKLNIRPRTIAIAAGAILGVIVLSLVLFIAFFPADLAAREAERRIEAATDRDLVIGGDVSVAFWPALGFSVEQAALSNPEGFPQDEPFIAADQIVFAVAIAPLLRGQIQVKQLIFDGAEVRLQAGAEGAANWTFPTEQTASSERMTIEDLRLDDVRLIDSFISFQGADGGPPLTLEDVDASMGLESLDSPARLQAALDYRGERLNIDGEIGLPRAVLENGETPINARLRGEPLEAQLEGDFNAETGALAGRLEASGRSLRRLMAWMGSPMDEGGGFGAFRVTGQMSRQGETTALSDLSIRLDDVEASGDLALINQENGRLRVNGALSSANVDLNPYLPAPAQSGQSAGVEVDQSWSQAPLDLSGLRALDAHLNLSLGALRFREMSFSNVALVLRLANGAADARLTRISLYGGSGVARLIADGSGAVPRIAVELDAQNIQAEPLLRDAIGFDRITGRGRLQASLLGQGASQAAVMRSLRGNASFLFADGQWRGVNLAQVARTVQAALQGQAIGSGGGATDFAELGATFAVANGVAATDDVRLLNPFVRLEGRGLIDIGAQTIDMRLAPRAVSSIEGQGGDVSVAGLGIPFRASGPWSRVSFRPALEDVVQSQVRDILGQQEQGSPLGALGDILFGRQPAESPAETPAPAEPAEGEAPAPAEPPEEQEQPRNPLEELFRRAIGGEPKQEEPTP